MLPLNSQDLERRAPQLDALVRQTPDIDHFCSSSFWILPAWRAFLPDHRLWAMETDSGVIALGIGTDRSLGTYVHPLEASWALACPFLGPDARALTRDFVQISRQDSVDWDILFLSGIGPDSPHFHELIRGFRGHYSLGLGPSSIRRVASLEDGVDGFMSRRSPKFRQNLRRSFRRAKDSGIKAEYIDHLDDPIANAHALLERALQIEHRSWKGNANTGIIDGPMKAFYRDMLPRLASRGALRFLFLTLDGVDIAYCFGGVFADTFRGLQMSYDDAYRKHSPGSLAQFITIQNLADEGVLRYDLGSDMHYKRDWAEKKMETLAIIVRKL